MKYSKQRELIRHAICHQLDHPTADQIYQAVRQQQPNISLGTVYRNLSQLSEVGEIRKISMSDGGDRYDGQLHEHYHMLCTHCGQVYDVSLPEMEQLNGSIFDRYGFQVEYRELILQGCCKKCSCQENPLVQ